MAPCKGIRIPECGKLLLGPGNLAIGIRKTGREIRNANNDWNPDSKIPSSTKKSWSPVPGIQNPRRGIQNPRLSWIPLHGSEAY